MDESRKKRINLVAERVTVAGFQEAYGIRSTKLERYLFRTALVLSLIAIGYASTTVLLHYLKQGRIFVSVDIIDHQAPFPNITICGPQAIKRSVVEKQILEHYQDLEDLITRSRLNLDTFIEELVSLAAFTLRVKPVFDAQRELVKVTDYLVDMMPEHRLGLYRVLYPSCQEMFNDCMFNNHKFNCCQVTELLVFDERVCYHFGLDAIDQTFQVSEPPIGSVRQSGFTVDVRIPNWSEVVFSDNVASDGYNIFLGSLPSPWSDPVSIPSDMDATIVLNAPTIITELSDCLRMDRLPRMHYARFYDPDGVGCIGERLAESLLVQYGCLLPALNYVPDNRSTICTTEQILGLDAIFNGEMFKGASGFGSGNPANSEHILRDSGRLAFRQCPPQCTRYLYSTISTSYGALISSDQGDKWDQLNRNTSWSRLSIFFPSASYHLQSEEFLNPAYMAMCEIGGIMGVYAGLSMVTVVQLLAYVIVIFGACEKEVIRPVENLP